MIDLDVALDFFAASAAVVILVWGILGVSSDLVDKPGPRCSANSAAAVGAGYGVPNPMSPDVLPVPSAIDHGIDATAQGIVTRMGQDPKGLGGEAIEPGPAGMRPASFVPRSENRGAWLSIAAFLDSFPARPLGAHARRVGAFSAAAAAGQACAARAADVGLHTPPSNTGVNKVSEVGHVDD